MENMAIRLSTRNRIFIASIIGTIILFTSFYMILCDLEADQRSLDGQFPLRAMDGVQEGLTYGAVPIIALALTGIVTGAVTGLLLRDEKFTEVTVHSGVAGGAVGVIAMLAMVVTGFAAITDDGVINALAVTLAGVMEGAPFYILVMLVLALLALAGGFASKLVLLGLNKIKAK